MRRNGLLQDVHVVPNPKVFRRHRKIVSRDDCIGKKRAESGPAEVGVWRVGDAFWVALQVGKIKAESRPSDRSLSWLEARILSRTEGLVAVCCSCGSWLQGLS